MNSKEECVMRSKEEIRRMIDAGQAVLGIELGSTRIKAVLIDTDKSLWRPGATTGRIST